MPRLCVVLWRPKAGAPWDVQPFTYAEAAAEIVAARLIEQFHGEAWIWIGEPEPVWPEEDTRDFRGGP
jgi:hypothetical protein